MDGCGDSERKLCLLGRTCDFVNVLALHLGIIFASDRLATILAVENALAVGEEAFYPFVHS